jgi:hypothetical protein
MNDELFNELMESVREGGAILRGEIAPSRRREILRKQPSSLVFFIFGALSVLAFVVVVRLVQEE